MKHDTGTVDRGNDRRGVHIRDGADNTVGGTAAGASNVISGNDWSGVAMDCRFNDSELREFYIATFLGLYLLSIWHRARRFQP